METWDALNARRQTREYTDEPVSDEQLDRVLEAGRRSPSSRNSQPWYFVVVTDEQTKAGLAETWQGAHWIPNAPVVIAVLADMADDPIREPIVEYDLGQAVSSMLLAATDLGLGSGQTASRDQDLARTLLGFPDSVYCSKLLTLGHPDRPISPITKPDRRGFDDVVRRGTWDG